MQITDMPATLVKLAVRFYPMQPKRMQECREALQRHKSIPLPRSSPRTRYTHLHYAQDEQRVAKPHREYEKQRGLALGLQHWRERHVPEHLR